MRIGHCEGPACAPGGRARRQSEVGSRFRLLAPRCRGYARHARRVARIAPSPFGEGWDGGTRPTKKPLSLDTPPAPTPALPRKGREKEIQSQPARLKR